MVLKVSTEERKKESKTEPRSAELIEKMIFVAKPAGPEPETPRPDKKRDRTSQTE